MNTTTPSLKGFVKDWYIVDAENQVLGTIASKVAGILRGKHKPSFTPNLDLGDNVIIVNADKISIESRKLENKKFYRHSGFPGGIRETSYQEELENPDKVVIRAVKGMLPKNKLANAQIKNLKVFVGSEHPYQAQKPKAVKMDRIKQPQKGVK